jgi:hypothetical protein
MWLATAGRQEIEGAVGASDEAVEAGTDEHGSFHDPAYSSHVTPLELQSASAGNGRPAVRVKGRTHPIITCR